LEVFHGVPFTVVDTIPAKGAIHGMKNNDCPFGPALETTCTVPPVTAID